MPNSVTFLKWLPILDWCVVRRGSENKHHKDIMCLKEIGLRLQIPITTPHLTVYILGRDL